MRTINKGLAMTGILALLATSVPSPADAVQAKAPKPASSWVLNAEEYFERPGLSVLVFHDTLPRGQAGRLEIIQHGERVAALGDVRLESAPGPMGQASYRRQALRRPGRQSRRSASPLRKGRLAYRVRVEPDGEALLVTVDLERPLPAEFVGRAGFNMEIFPAAYFGKSYTSAATDGVFTRQGNGPTVAGRVGRLGEPLAEGPVFTAAPEDPLRRLTIESLTGDDPLLRRAQHGHQRLVPGPVAHSRRRAKGAVRWRITPNAVASWMAPAGHRDIAGRLPSGPRKARRHRARSAHGALRLRDAFQDRPG